MRMFRTLIVASAMVTTLAVATPAFAQQNQVNTGLGIGALAGLTMSSLQCENEGDCLGKESGNGFVLGIWFGGNRDGRAGLMGEISYATKKFNVEGIEVKKSYVEIPVLLRINAGARERDKPSVYFLVGPVFDIQFQATEDGDSVDDVYQGLEIGLMFGAGFEVARVGIEGRYSWALRSVLGTDAAEEAGFGSVKLNTFSIVAKIRFN